MSGVSSFLQKQKKADLVDLAGELGLEHEGLKKTDLELTLEDYLTTNSSKHSGETRFASFYNSKRRSESSPVKKEAPSLLDGVETTAKAVKRRVTRAAEEFVPTTDDSEVEPATTRARSSALARTPGRSLSNIASNVPLPPSPAVVADAIDRRTAVIRSKILDVYEDSGITEAVETTRESLSTLLAVQSIIVLFELYKLRPEILPNRYAFTIPAVSLLHTPEYPVSIPDLFLLLTASFWGPALLWLATTFVIPLSAAYFINLSSKPVNRSSRAQTFKYNFDPLTFNIVKALTVFVVFGQDVTFGGLVDLENVARINSAIYGGYKGVLTGNAIGAIFTLYDALHK